MMCATWAKADVYCALSSSLFLTFRLALERVVIGFTAASEFIFPALSFLFSSSTRLSCLFLLWWLLMVSFLLRTSFSCVRDPPISPAHDFGGSDLQVARRACFRLSLHSTMEEEDLVEDGHCSPPSAFDRQRRAKTSKVKTWRRRTKAIGHVTLARTYPVKVVCHRRWCVCVPKTRNPKETRKKPLNSQFRMFQFSIPIPNFLMEFRKKREGS